MGHSCLHLSKMLLSQKVLDYNSANKLFPSGLWGQMGDAFSWLPELLLEVKSGGSFLLAGLASHTLSPLVLSFLGAHEICLIMTGLHDARFSGS